MEDFRTKVLSYTERFGPVLPIQISKELNTNLIFAGAILSELVEKKSLLISNVKKGSSPFYFIKGQEEKLQNLAVYLGSKEKEIHDLIKENLVLQDNNLEAWQRVAIRGIKDFAVKIEYSHKDNLYIFWRWYLLSEEEALKIIKDGLSEDVQEDTKIIMEAKEDKSEVYALEPKIVKEENLVEEVVIPKLYVDHNHIMLNYFKESGIKVLGSHIVRKNNEINYEIEIESDLGSLKYLAKFKNKNLINDKDLNKALNEGVGLGIPVILFSNGMLNKKGREFLLKNSTFIIFKNLELLKQNSQN